MTEKVPANREEQIRKLPVWVRNMLAAKDREIADRDKLLAELSTTAPGIAVRDRHKVAIPVAFDRYDVITFALHGNFSDDTMDDYLSVCSRNEGELEIRGDGRLSVVMAVSNCFTVKRADT